MSDQTSSFDFDAGSAFTTEEVATIILAAGGSKRLGTPKQLCRVAGKTLITRAVECAAALPGPIFVVLGAHYEAIRAEIREMGFTLGDRLQVVLNSNWEEGLSGSIRSAIEGIERSDQRLKAAIVTLCDQPLIDKELLLRLIEAAQTESAHIAACRYSSSLGVPALFTRNLFEELCRLKGDHGAKSVIMNYRQPIASVAFELGAFDVDSKEQLESLEDYLTAQ